MATSTYYRVLFFYKGKSDQYLQVTPSSFAPSKNMKGTIKAKGTLSEMSFTKKIFAPCEINLTLNLYSPTDYSEILEEFKNFSTVKLEHTKDGTNFYPIAENYIIRRIKPVYTKVGSSTCIILYLTICSPDIILTDKKYCRTYVKEKLGTILSDAVTTLSKETGTGLTSTQNMQFLAYKNTSDKMDEFRHPYLVQYNESVYDLVARTANRCGEFLYYEGGTLNLGLRLSMGSISKEIKIIKISGYDTLDVNGDAGKTIPSSLNRYVYDNRFVCGTENKSRGTATCPINNEAAYDEYLGSFSKGAYTSAKGEDVVNCHMVSDIFSTLLQCQVWYETLVHIPVQNEFEMTLLAAGIHQNYIPDGDIHQRLLLQYVKSLFYAVIHHGEFTRLRLQAFIAYPTWKHIFPVIPESRRLPYGLAERACCLEPAIIGNLNFIGKFFRIHSTAAEYLGIFHRFPENEKPPIGKKAHRQGILLLVENEFDDHVHIP